MAFITKLQDLVAAINDLATAVGLLAGLQTELSSFDTFLDSL